MDEKLKPYDSDDEYKLKLPTPTRRESESSTVRSQCVLENAMSKSTPHLKTYGFYLTRKLDLKICDEQKNIIYFAQIHEFTSAPDVVLRQGIDKHAPIVGVARFRLSSDLKLGLGDPDTNEKDTVWENMKNISWGLGHSKYCFEMTVNNERRSFLWQRTRDSADGVQGIGKLINWNYKLVDEKTGEVLGVYLDNLKSWSKKGKLQLKADLGEDWELMVLLGCLGLCEKASRRVRRRAGAGAGVYGNC
ncbi:hypothetical protein EPUS_08918 [Endocarpon pusillum Z07020]|uniref:Uncharacterized protein n=1 Tax=Endocarpon pusillum (strain Z07020 / HMAS-L-300199) TaxID=1263415 RepID=U1HJY1_ENDPU|nr:uncharacterized protein EPUS_08918 [Endocarpon pusillum Z07020]ERF69239.1 hypothetical protein EPUS_08918 [Endocarpon pusillum Z07020]